MTTFVIARPGFHPFRAMLWGILVKAQLPHHVAVAFEHCRSKVAPRLALVAEVAKTPACRR